MPFDGCSSDCQNEPICTGGGPCTSRCGDGIVLDEDCDDGNLVDGDGCSSSCTVEPGFSCSQPPLGDFILVSAVYRDFRFHAPSDFEPGVTGGTTAAAGIVEDNLDGEGKPVFTGVTGATVHIESKDTFAEWYRNTDGVNHATPSKLALWNNGGGAYVNRYGKRGEQWPVIELANRCGEVGQELTDDLGQPIPCTFFAQSDQNRTDCQIEEAKGYTQLPGSCHADATGVYSAQYVVKRVDGNPLFFPVDNDSFSASEMTGGQVPSEPSGMYDETETWPWDLDEIGNKRLHNFSFTSEIRSWFRYEPDETYTLDFVGDEDAWVFVNRKLAVDLGGVHTPVAGSVIVDGAAAGAFGLSPGKVYEIAVFHAERQTTCSALEVTMRGFNMAASVCVRD